MLFKLFDELQNLLKKTQQSIICIVQSVHQKMVFYSLLSHFNMGMYYLCVCIVILFLTAIQRENVLL